MRPLATSSSIPEDFCFQPSSYRKSSGLFWCFAFSENASNNRLRPSRFYSSSLKKAQLHSSEIKPPGWNTLIKVELFTILRYHGGSTSEATTSLNGFYGNCFKTQSCLHMHARPKIALQIGLFFKARAFFFHFKSNRATQSSLPQKLCFRVYYRYLHCTAVRFSP